MFPDKTIIVGTTALFNKLDWSTIDTVIATSLDAQLTLPDYRSHETTLQQLIWLRNRVARLYIQTYAPDHPVIQALHQPYPEQWYKQTLRERKRFHYPPYVLI
jgi:primosomal protein N' (replication factor Y)